jgi:hypothetical protein
MDPTSIIDVKAIGETNVKRKIVGAPSSKT